ncbi:hypothetical protein FRB93_010051 [Tulasnella sp. JGI-2019a]|nr:hypothetical protein FRB93_010051 [Tulasnella sp. JGI-2019a]
MDLSRAIVSFKAGRAQRREGTNWVDPSPTKGLVSIVPGQDDGLLHLYWVNRENNNVEEDLILFPGDASFVPVPQVQGGRTYVLKFTSSDQRVFFWMQDLDPLKDGENVTKLNSALSEEQDESMAAEPEVPAAPQPLPTSSTSSVAPIIPPMNLPPGTTPEEVARLRALLQSMGSRGGPSGSGSGGRGQLAFAQPGREETTRSFLRPSFTIPSNFPVDLSLAHVLTLQNLQPVLSNPSLLQSLIYPALPTDLPSSDSPPSADTIRRIVESPPFQASVRQLDQAFATGMMQGLAAGLGLPSEAGSSMAAFLKAIGEKNPAKTGGGEGGMDTS